MILSKNPNPNTNRKLNLLRLPKNFTVAWLFVFALTIRWVALLLVLWINPKGIWTFDGHGYADMARLIGEGWLWTPASEDASVYDLHRTPLYPLFVYLSSGGGYYITLLVQTVLAGITAVFSYKTARFFVSEKWALAAGFFTAIDLPSIVFTNLIMTETLFTFLLVTGCYQLIHGLKTGRKTKFFLAFFFLALATLSRPVSIFLPLFIFPVIVLFFRKNTTAYLQGSILVYLPVIGLWILRNFVLFGSLYYAHIGSFNLLYFQAASVHAQAHQIPVEESRNILFHQALEGSTNAFNFYTAGKKVALKTLAQHPGYTFKNIVKAETNLFFRPMVASFNQQFGIKNKAIDYSIAGVQLLLLGLLYSGIFLTLRSIVQKQAGDQRAFLLLWILVVAYFMLTCNGPEIDARFRIPLLPFLAVLSVVGWRNHKNRKKV